MYFIYLFIYLFILFYFIYFTKRAWSNLSISVREQTRTIAPSDQFRRLQISAELLNVVTTHYYASLFASIRTIRTILYSLFATVYHYTHYSHYFLFAFRDYSLFGFSRQP